MILYHCTTLKKYNKYKKSGCILMPVRGWKTFESALDWCKHTGRNLILKIESEDCFPLPDHKPLFLSYWTPHNIYKWELVFGCDNVKLKINFDFAQ